ncbi:MAG: diphosphate--fructose-6-phosphate 1-phosphotransferase [Chlamydiia bacterium]|nr:diphosphate--fructose-6-phosphate 1-phosphotransferase [Chlamydiia bacterium]
MEDSPLHSARRSYQPDVPKILSDLRRIRLQPGQPSNAATDQQEIKRLFPKTYGQPRQRFVSEPDRVSASPLRIGLVLSGGQAAGGHNVIAGIFDAVQELDPRSVVYGFLGGPSGIVKAQYLTLTTELVDAYRNQGGFDMIGSGRTKIESAEQIAAAEKTARALDLDGLVIIGGDDSNTNAAVLAEAFAQSGCRTRVVGVPKTIDGDLKTDEIEVSFGFDTACKTFSDTIGSVARDAVSAGKYYFFIKLMGRSASHVAVECALQTHPNHVLVGEEVAAQRRTLRELTNEIADTICARAAKGKDYGVILIPEGIIEFIPEFRELIRELNTLLSPHESHAAKMETMRTSADQSDYIQKLLSEASVACFAALPRDIQEQLLLDRDPHGNVQVSKIETERLFIQTVTAELRRRKATQEYSGKFSAQPLFMGYEGRSCLPSNFDAQYCYALGRTAVVLIQHGQTGYLACVQGLTQPASEWTAMGLPITSLFHLELRHGSPKPVIRKALVEVDGPVFQRLQAEREGWKADDAYRYPGPIQFYGPAVITESRTETLRLERQEAVLSS